MNISFILDFICVFWSSLNYFARLIVVHRLPLFFICLDHRTPSNSSQLSVDESKSNAAHSSNTLLPINPNEIVSSLQRTRSPSESVATTNSKFSLEETPHTTRSNRLECMRHLRLAIDSDDEMDDRFEKEKTVRKEFLKKFSSFIILF